MNFEICSGEHCFIIGHHIKEKYILKEAINRLVTAGFDYFNIFGEQADLWSEVIITKENQKRQIQVEASKIDRMSMSYNLAMLATLKPESTNFVISDDEYFTEYLIEDLHDIFSEKSKFTPFDWKKFKDGYEFIYHKKDAIVSISGDIAIGFLKKEKVFNSIDKAFRYKLFDGKSFNEIWDEISKTLY
ncbi:hypothetical protein [Anaerococcus vaginalis]|nr:hypothetical protein [Anaerococcus vaginalis]